MVNPQPAVQSKNDTLAQAVFLAQLEAVKGKCDCKACQILRKASDSMTAQFLESDDKPRPDEVLSRDALQARASG